MKLFADDVKVYSDVTYTTAHLQLFLDSMVVWTHIWHLKLSLRKCSVLACVKNIYNSMHTIYATILL